jgi:hypothetical protein
MKNTASILLAIMLSLRAVMPIFDDTECRKISALVKHLHEHQQESRLGVWDFFVLHYGFPTTAHKHSSPQHSSNLPNHDTHRDHQSLPLHSLSGGATLLISSDFRTSLLMPILSVVHTKLPVQRLVNYSFFFAASVFQPPKY